MKGATEPSDPDGAVWESRLAEGSRSRAAAFVPLSSKGSETGKACKV